MNFLNLPHDTQIAVRRAQPEDANLVFEMHKRLSPTTVYNRYLRGYAPRMHTIQEMCAINESQGMAFVATAATPTEEIIGMAYYIIDADNPRQETAEPAILVEDRFQMQGVGSYLAAHMADYARTHGINTFTALISASNQSMFRILQRSGLHFTSQYASGTREIRIFLNEPEITVEPAAVRMREKVS